MTAPVPRAPDTETVSSEVATPPSGTVLVVDDQESNRHLLRRFLTADGYLVHEAVNGPDALRSMSSHRPDVVLLDLMMPGMSGYDVLRAKANDPAIASIPVLMLTADTQPSAKIEGLELGVSDYLTKPFSPPELRARVRNLVRVHRQAAELTRLNAVLARAAVTDALTGLENRRGFDVCWQREISRSERYSVALALVIFDIDNFKLINDQFGHPTGDAVLTSVAQLLASGVRMSDMLARIGGEEFGLALINTDETCAMEIAEKLRHLVSATVIEPLPLPCTVSVGVAASTALPLADLFAAADRALYQAKRGGRNRVVLAGMDHARTAHG